MMLRARRAGVSCVLVVSSFAGGYLAAAAGASEPATPPADRQASRAADESRREPAGRSRNHPRNAPRPVAQLADATTAEEALERALAAETEPERFELLRAAAGLVPEAAIEDALGWVSRIGDVVGRDEFAGELVLRLAERDPLSAATHALALEGARSRRTAVESVVRRWVGSDLDGATRWALDQPASSTRTASLRVVVNEIAEVDPERAVGLVAELGPREAGMATGQVFAQWADRDPRAAVAAVARLRPGEARSMAIESTARAWAGDDPVRAIEWARALASPTERRNALFAAANEWSFNAPGDAFRNLASCEELSAADLAQLAGTWTRTEPEAAVSYLQSLPPGPRRNAALATAASELSYNHPVEAARLCDELPVGPERARIVDAVAMELAAQDAAGAVAWAQGLRDPEDRRAALTRAIGTLSETDVEGALELVETMPPGEERAGAVAEIMWSWGRADPAAAAQWLRREGGNPSAYSEVVRAWSDVDREGVARWVTALPRSPSRDAAVGAASDAMVRDDAARAWRLAETIDDPTERDEQLAWVAREWLAADPDRARAQIAAGNLDPRTRARYLGEAVPDDDPAAADPRCVCAGDDVADEDGAGASAETEEPIAGDDPAAEAYDGAADEYEDDDAADDAADDDDDELEDDDELDDA